MNVYNIYDFQKSNPDTFQQFPLKDNLFLYYNCPQREQILKLYSVHIQINFTISGNKLYRHGNNTWFADESKGLFLKKAAFQVELSPDYSGFEVLVFYLMEDYLRSIFDEYSRYLNLADLPKLNTKVMEEFFINEYIRDCYLSIIPYFEKKGRLPEQIIENKFKELIFNMLSHPQNKHILTYVMNITNGYQMPIWQVMEDNYIYDLKIEDFANISHRSLSTFNRDFKDYYDTTPARWLTERRLDKAKYMLETTNKTIGEIAYDTGFINASHFSRLFKEKYGKNPARFHNFSFQTNK